MTGAWGDEDVFGFDVVLAFQEGQEREIHVYCLCTRKFELLRTGVTIKQASEKRTMIMSKPLGICEPVCVWQSSLLSLCAF